MTKTVLNGSNSKMCKSLNYVCHRYNINKFSLHKSYMCLVKDNTDPMVEMRGTLIRDFPFLRDEIRDDNDLASLIDDQCTM